MKVAKPIQNLIDSFSRLPGIGPKTAQRLAFYLLHVPQTELDKFAESISEVKRRTKVCSVCKNISETDPCVYCDDTSRDSSVIMVVEQPLDIFAVERTGKFKGKYHVLHGAINPLENIGPEEIFIDALIARANTSLEEVIIATNPTMEGEATAMYITKRLKEKMNGETMKITRLGMGVPTGAYLEFADEMTLGQALEGRRIV